MGNERNLKWIIINAAVTALITYIVLGGLMFIFQKSFIYHPNDQNFEDCSGFSDYQKIDYNGTRFYFKQGVSDKVVLYYHGNAGSACDRSFFSYVFEKTDASVIYVEYAGYSNDSRKPSIDLILLDVQNMYNFLRLNKYENIIIYGQSIGSGAASYHASLGNVDHLILTTPFSRLTDVAQTRFFFYPTSYLLTEKYDNIKWLNNYRGDLLIIHGDNDHVIPNKLSKKLHDEISVEDKEYILIEGKGHNNIWSSLEFRDLISEYIENSA